MIHPFHPWYGREFVFVALRQTWGQDRVFFYDGEGTVCSLPTSWTDAVEPDVFVVVAAGRSAFRVEDLIELTAMVEAVGHGRPDPV